MVGRLTAATGSATVPTMDCCSEPSLSTLTIRENGLAWCPICGAEYRLEWTIEDGFHLVLVTVGIAEPAKLDGIRIPA